MARDHFEKDNKSQRVCSSGRKPSSSSTKMYYISSNFFTCFFASIMTVQFPIIYIIVTWGGKTERLHFWPKYLFSFRKSVNTHTHTQMTKERFLMYC